MLQVWGIVLGLDRVQGARVVSFRMSGVIQACVTGSSDGKVSGSRFGLRFGARVQGFKGFRLVGFRIE